MLLTVITGPPIYSVGGRLVMLSGVCRRHCLSSVTLNGGPVVFHPVRATPCEHLL